MKRYPHKPHEKHLRTVHEENSAHYAARLAKMGQAEAQRNPQFFKGRCEAALELAALEYAFDAPISQVKSLLNEAKEHAAKAVAFDQALEPTLYMTYLSLGNVCDDRPFRATLEGFERNRFTNPSVTADEVFYLAAESMRDLSAGEQRKEKSKAERGLVRLRSGQVNQLAAETTEAILAIEAAVADSDEKATAAAFLARDSDYAREYSQAAVRNYPSGLMDVIGLGLMSIAKRSGISSIPPSVYRSADLIK